MEENICTLGNEEFYLEFPSIKRKEEAINYINEFKEANSEVHGDGSLENYLESSSYEEWIEFISVLREKNYNGYCRGETYYLIRVSDNKIVGMVNMRYELNDYLREFGGHVGYAIVPSERGKKYNKVNTYLALRIFREKGFDEIIITCAKDNVGSRKSIKSLASEFQRCRLDSEDNQYTNVYSVNTIMSIEKLEKYFAEYTGKNNERKSL